MPFDRRRAIYVNDRGEHEGMRRIGVLTSGGDAPGMNAAIRAVTRTARNKGIEVIGFIGGYEGLMDDDTVHLDIAAVGGILQRGGTILKTARSERFRTEEGVEAAVATLQRHDIDGLVTIGGDGTFRGALDLAEHGVTVAGIPGTIDNDMGYTDYTIGFDTAVNTVVEAIGKLKDTALAHNKTTIIEVMGRHCGDIALYSGLTGGAEYILLPEMELDMDSLAKKIREGIERGKHHCIIIKAEGVDIHKKDLAAFVEDITGDAPRVVVLGYLQRGGSPSARDRLLASLMGAQVVEQLESGASNIAVGMSGNAICTTELKAAVQQKREADLDLLRLMYSLA